MRPAGLLGDRRQRQIVRRRQPDRAAIDQAVEQGFRADLPVVRVGALKQLVEQKNRLPAGRRPDRRCRGCGRSPRRIASGRPAANRARAASRRRRAASVYSGAARTGAPAIASTTLTPTVRSSVLLPDMFEPLTISSRTCGVQDHVVANHPRGGDERMPEARVLRTARVRLRRTPGTDRPDARTRRRRAS